MALPVINGLRSTCPAPAETGSDVVVAVMATPSTDAPAQSHPNGLTPAQRRERLYPFLREAS